MNQLLTCPACGAELPKNRLSGLCPSCAWRGLSDLDEDLLPPQPTVLEPGIVMRVPGYDILGEIARGGMGIVYRARQSSPSRTVALKMLLPQQLCSLGMAERFRLEVRALIELEHPAILPLYHVGEYEGLPFFTMKLAAGGTLASRCEQFSTNWRAIAELISTLADAVHYAHERGVLHRDLKPGNILFDEQDRPYVSDFGLAKLVNSEADLTRSADFLGTPHYVAPEVAARSARQATTASDIYSLGAVLYELLAQVPPFEAEGIPALLKKIAEDDPLSPGARKREAASHPDASNVPQVGISPPQTGTEPNFSVPRDLEVICLKCLAKEPHRRYISAREIGDDLRRWLSGEPIMARPVSHTERAWKWVRRNPILAGMGTTLLLIVLGGGLALWKSDRDVRSALLATQEAEEHAQQSLRESLLAQAKGLGAAHATGQRWLALDALRRAAAIRPGLDLRNEAAAALARPDLREISRFPATFGEAGSSAVFTSELKSYITPEPLGGFTLRATKDQAVLRRYPGVDHRPARWFVLSPDDAKVAALQEDYSLEIWPLDGQAPLLRWPGNSRQPPAAEFHPDTKLLAGFVRNEGVFVQDWNGKKSISFPPTNARTLFLRFDPAGEKLALVREPGGIEVWSCVDSSKLLWSQPMLRAVPWLAWSPDGRRLIAAADDDRGIRVLAGDSGETVLSYSRHLLYPRQFEFSPEGHTVASVGQDWTLRLWDSRTGQDMVTGVGRHRVMRFSRDGGLLTTAPSDHHLAVLELAKSDVFREFRSTPANVVPFGLSCTSDGRLLLTSNPQVRVYDTLSGQEISILNLPVNVSKHAFFDMDGTAIFYSFMGNGIYRRAFSCSTNTLGTPALQWGAEEQIALHPAGIIWNTLKEGQTWIYQGVKGVDLWEHRDPQHARHIDATGNLASINASEDGKWLCCADAANGLISVWNCQNGVLVTNLAGHSPDHVWFSPDSKWLVASVEEGYCTWQTGTWIPGAHWEARLDSGDTGEVKFSADSRLMVARQERESFQLFEFPECRRLVTLKPPLVVPVRYSCLSPDGSRLWLLAGGYRIFEWNLTNLKKELSKLGLDWGQGKESSRAVVKQ